MLQESQDNCLGEELVLSTNDSRTTGYPHTKEWNWIPTSHHIKKLTQNDQRLKYESYNYRTIEENIDTNLCEVGLGYNSLGPKQKVQVTKSKLA